MKDWNIPGLAIAIVKDGKVVMMKGYGVRNTETKEPVDENTLFMIASNSKLFTATALAQLEYDKKLSLNDKITKYFPSYKLYNDNTTMLKECEIPSFSNSSFQANWCIQESIPDYQMSNLLYLSY